MKQSLSSFIARMARKIAIVYPSNYADEEDYIQEGHLKLAEIRRNGRKHNNFHAYAIVAIANTMRNAALDAMCSVSVPRRTKKQVHKIEMFLAAGKTEQTICQEMRITHEEFNRLRSLINTESWQMLFQEPTHTSEPFSILDDLLSSSDLTGEDKMFILSQINDTIDDLRLSRWERYARAKTLRLKLARSSYGI